MNVVLVSNLFPNPMEPLRGTFTASLVRALQKEVTVTAIVVPLPWFPRWKVLKGCARFYTYAQIPDRWEWEGISVFCPKYFFLPKVMGALQPLTFFFSIFRILAQLKKKGLCSLLNAHFVYPDGVATAWAARLLDLPVVLTALGTDLNSYWYYRFRRPQIMSALLGASRITAVSQALVHLIIQQGISSKKVFHIATGVDPTIFYPQDPVICRETLKLDPSRKHILFVGRLSEEKNVTTLIEAVRILQEVNEPCFDLHLVGDGPMRPKLAAQARLLRYPDRVYFHGAREPSDLSLWYNAVSMLCLPSLQEGTPNVILEALASGIPVLASNVGGCVELIQEPINGYLLSPSDPAMWADRIRTALLLSWDVPSITASVRNHTWEQTAKAYRAVYEQAL